MKTISLLAAAVSLALAGAAVAGPKAVLPADLPPYAPDRPLPVPAIQKTTLSNGLEVWIVPRTGLPRVDAVLAIRGAGLAADDAQHPGFANVLAGLLNEGSAKHDSKAIAEAAQGLGGSIGAGASNDGMMVSANALASHASEMLALLGEVARTPTFPDNEVRLAQANALQSLKASEAQPAFKAERALAPAIYGDHPYARTQPTEASIMSVTPQLLRDAHAQRFRPDHALLVIAGPIDGADAMRAVQAAFGDWKANGAALADTPDAPRTATPKYVLVQRDGSVQSAIRLGRPGIAATDADYVPLQLAGTVLGGGFSSRLMQNLREDKGYTYGARGGSSALREGGRISASADVRNEVTGAAIKEFEAEFKRMGDEPVPAQELEDTKRYVAGGYLLNNQMQGAVAGTLAGNWLVGLPAEFLGQYVPKIRAVDAAQVQAVSKKYFDPKDQSIIVVGDPKAVAEQLKQYGSFEVRAK
ncbi:insulinase family protein [Lysobacter sp. TY2-98]|uniref:M16 family metallopeptidase n=1 Tax=Lysobacter sp. TY2-98 TaxID=2290922 RepID=UPI000E2070C3|nr:pitrilysin family protein [Lysobacter sp. TY2-98]AXK73008.1 insulinase family protein [Lysobacter sp. TY2-98]